MVVRAAHEHDDLAATRDGLLDDGRSLGHDFQPGTRTRRGGVTTCAYACRFCPARVLVRPGPRGFARAHGVDQPCPRYWGKAASGERAPAHQLSLLAAPPQAASIVLRRQRHAYEALDVQVLEGGYRARRYCPQCDRVTTYRVRVDEPDPAPCQTVLDAGLPEVRALLARLSPERSAGSTARAAG